MNGEAVADSLWEDRAATLVEALTDRLRKVSDRVGVPINPAPQQVKALYIAPYATEDRIRMLALNRKRDIFQTCGIDLDLKTADPPFQQENEIDSKGYWLNPQARDQEARVKKLRSQVCAALMCLLQSLEKERPRILIGEGQGGTVLAMSTFPVILERACRDRAVPSHQLQMYRQALDRIGAVWIIDPVILPATNNRASLPFAMLSQGFPQMELPPVSYTHLTLPTKA